MGVYRYVCMDVWMDALRSKLFNDEFIFASKRGFAIVHFLFFAFRAISCLLSDFKIVPLNFTLTINNIKAVNQLMLRM